MTVLTKVVDGTINKLGSFKSGNDAFDLMMRDFLKEAGIKDIPEYIDEDFVGVDLENLQNLITKYEVNTEYGYNDGDKNSFFLSKGSSNYYWHLSYEDDNLKAEMETLCDMQIKLWNDIRSDLSMMDDPAEEEICAMFHEHLKRKHHEAVLKLIEIKMIIDKIEEEKED